jgi:cytochrome-b5 reductase
MASTQDDSWLARHYIDYVYVPATLLVVGTLVVKRDWVPYSILVAVALGAYNFYQFRESEDGIPIEGFAPADGGPVEIKKVLKPDVFQDFELKEKTVISHNVAM